MKYDFKIINKSNPMNYKPIKVTTTNETLINKKLLSFNNNNKNIKSQLISTSNMCILGILSLNY